MTLFLNTEQLVKLSAELKDNRASDLASENFHGEASSDRQARVTDLVTAWYTVLVRQTLEWAQTTAPYYAERCRDGLAPPANAFDILGDFARIPVIFRSDLAAGGVEFLSSEVRSNGASSTSGTTGRRLTIYSCEEENGALRAFRAIVSGRRLPEGSLILRVIPGNRRTHIAQSTSNPGDVSMITLGYISSQAPGWFDYTDHMIEVLSEIYMLNGTQRRVSVLHITPPVVLDIITLHLRQKYIDPKIFGITDIAVSGAFMQEQTRRMIEQDWGARWHHSYSCAEINGELMADHADPSLFHVPRTLYCEILDPLTRQPVAVGEAGLVVLTSLYPFQQAMPLVRYANGDIAQRADDRPTPYVTAIRPIGRLADVVELAPGCFVGTRDMLAASTAFSEIPQVPYPRFSLRLEDDRTLVMDLEITLPGYSSTGLTEALVAERLDEEIRRYGYPEDVLPSGVRCRFLPKNSLSTFPRVVPER